MLRQFSFGIPFFLFLAVFSIGLTGCGSKPTERIRTIYVLKADPTPQNIARIRELLADPDRDVRATAVNALVGNRVDDATGIALAALSDEDGFVRSIAAKLLGDLQDPGFAPALVEVLLRDPDPIVRQRAAEALGRLGGEAALEGLAAGMDDPAQNVRLVSVKGLKRLDPGFAKPALLRLLIEDSTWEVRVQVATTLGLTADPELRPALEAALDDPNEFVRSAVSNAIRSLDEAGDAPNP